MVVDLIVVGKTDLAEVAALVEMYQKRINFYTKFNVVTVPDPRRGAKIAASTQKREEGALILKLIAPQDYVVLLDERGREYTSMEFAAWLEKRRASAVRRVCFVVGGPYGFSEEVRARANDAVSLSRMTFSHQIVRALFSEQLYRAFTILGNEPYHHEGM